jgi:hypothetical protein
MLIFHWILGLTAKDDERGKDDGEGRSFALLVILIAEYKSLISTKISSYCSSHFS